MRIFNELEIANKISATLGAMSVAVFHAHIPAAGDESEENGFVKTLDSLEEKIETARLELQNMSFESSILNEERVALEARASA